MQWLAVSASPAEGARVPISSSSIINGAFRHEVELEEAGW
jgi:hypothetical protein